MPKLSAEEQGTYHSVIAILSNIDKSIGNGAFLLAEGKLKGLDSVMGQLREGKPTVFPDDIITELQEKINDAKTTAYELGAEHYRKAAETAATEKDFEVATKNFRGAYERLQRAYELIKAR